MERDVVRLGTGRTRDPQHKPTRKYFILFSIIQYLLLVGKRRRAQGEICINRKKPPVEVI
jgi:hypothetical protein